MAPDAPRRALGETTAYDRLMLETLIGGDLLMRQLPTSSTDDLRGVGRSFSRTASVSLGAGAREALLEELRPLLFVTAWKLLDLIVETERAASTGTPPPSKGWPIKNKLQWIASAGAPSNEPFASHPKFWRRLATLYAKLAEPRNAVIHRQYKRSASAGLVPYSPRRRPLRTITAGEIDALVFASYGLTEEVITGRGDRRRCIAIAWRFDQLRGVTNLAPLSVGSLPQLRRVLVNLERHGRRWRLDLGAVRRHLESQDVSSEVADIEAFMPGSARRFVGRLEDAPAVERYDFAASRPPSWLTASAY
jgi:hypothetical protein